MQPDINAYLDRIGYTGPVEATPETLGDLQYAHLHTVPYENLDIVRGVPLSLEIPALYDKIVTRRRGGYCFELNGLFSWLLRMVGFEVTDLFARFLSDSPGSIPKRRHHVIRVFAPGGTEAYLADVGVGYGTPDRPLRLVYGEVQRQGGASFRFDLDLFLGWVLKKQVGGGPWEPLYSFTEEPQLPVDYETTSFFCEQSPQSPFNKEAMAALRTAEGRNTLQGNVFKQFSGEEVSVRTAQTQAAQAELLARLFGIVC